MWPCEDQCPLRFLSIIGPNPRVSNQFHVGCDLPGFLFMDSRHIPQIRCKI